MKKSYELEFNPMLVKIVLVLMLLLLVGRAFAGLSQNKTSSLIPIQKLPLLESSVANNHEIIRLNGYPGGNIYHVKTNNTFIIPTTLRSESWINFWRVNADGIVIDSFSPDGKYEKMLPASGIFFRKENYIDWAFTGDRSPKPYVNVLNTQSLEKKGVAEIMISDKQIAARNAFIAVGSRRSNLFTLSAL